MSGLTVNKGPGKNLLFASLCVGCAVRLVSVVAEADDARSREQIAKGRRRHILTLISSDNKTTLNQKQIKICQNIQIFIAPLLLYSQFTVKKYKTIYVQVLGSL